MKPAACARSAARDDLLAGGVRPPVGDVVVDRGAEQERVVGDDADLAAQRVELDLAHVDAVDQHLAAGDVVVAAEQGDERRLARAGGARQRDGRAAVDREVDVAQHRGAVLVVERDVAQLDAAVAGRQRRREVGRGDPRLAVEDLEQPHARRGRALAEAERDAERAHRRDQHQQVRVEGREVAGGQRAVDHLAAADDQDRREPELGEEADERLVEGAQAGREHRLVEDAVDGVAEALELARLGRERLDHADAGDVLLRLGGQLSDPLLDLLDGRPRAPPVAERDDDHERHRRERQRRERRVLGEHRDRREQDRQRALGDPDEAVAEEEADRLQVDRRARHELAGLLAVEEAELERLQVAVEPVAQVVLDAERDLARHDPPPDREDEPHEAGHDEQRAQRLEARLVTRVDVIDHTPDQPRDRRRAEHRDACEHDRPDRSPAVGTKEAEEPDKGAHATTRYDGRARPHLQHSRTDVRRDRSPQPLRHGQRCLG